MPLSPSLDVAPLFAGPVQSTIVGGTAISILTPGYTSPHYDVSVFRVGVKLRF